MSNGLIIFLSICAFSLLGVNCQWPCPDREIISPCICIYNQEDETPHLELDCSAATNEEQLKNSCNQLYPIPNMFLFVLRVASDDEEAVDNIFYDTLGELSFESIDISDTSVARIEIGAFNNSQSSLRSLIVISNPLDSIPIDFSDFSNLEIVDLNNNNLGFIAVNSSSLLSVTLRGNNLHDTMFENLEKLEFLDLSDNLFIEVPELDYLPKLDNLNLENNNIDFIANGSFYFGGDNKPVQLTHLNLNYNEITEIDQGSFGGVAFGFGAKLEMRGNQISTLDEDNWDTLLTESIVDGGLGILDLTDNPILCGCDIAWIVSDPNLLDKISSTTACSDGTLLTDIDGDLLAKLCDPSVDLYDVVI